VHHIKRISFSFAYVLRFGITVNRRPVVDARRICEPRLVRVSKKESWSSEPLLLSLRCHHIAMVQPAESRKGLNLAFTRRTNFCCTTCWRVLRQSRMRPVLMVIEQVGRHQSFEMPLIQDDQVVQQVAQLPTQRSATPFCHGLPKAVRVGSLPMSFTAKITSAPNLASRSNSKNLCGCL